MLKESTRRFQNRNISLEIFFYVKPPNNSYFRTYAKKRVKSFFTINLGEIRNPRKEKVRRQRKNELNEQKPVFQETRLSTNIHIVREKIIPCDTMTPIDI